MLLSQLEKNPYFIPVVVTTLTFFVLLFLRTLLRTYWKRWNNKNPHPFSPAALKVTRVPSVYWCLAIALHLGMELCDLPKAQSRRIDQLIHITLVLSVFNVISQIAVMASKAFLIRTNGLLLGLIRGAILVVGLLISMSILGISIAPILTALGVGGVAVALAVKDTLENLFAGLYLLSEGALRVGDLIRLDSGQEGIILDIGWRTTKIKTGQNNTLLIPNSKLSQSLVTNFNLPEQKIGVTIPVPVGIGADLEKVEQVLLQVVKKCTEEVAGVLNSPEASIVFMGLQSDGNLLFNLNCFIQNFKHQTAALSELRKRIFKSLIDNHIPLPELEK
ncbi:MAG: mechanosensitive ion channel family protein [Proteobacteria bacterium]|nr:mechanosensitive ion channel family protein [Pseudomonadota bacterium]